ncbi:MAG: hypothetical protein ABR552_09395 [Actinomycetota bacterium]
MTIRIVFAAPALGQLQRALGPLAGFTIELHATIAKPNEDVGV